MKKIRLDLDQLHVDSFATAAERAQAKGTVMGHEATAIGRCDPFGNEYDSLMYCPADWTFESCGAAGCVQSNGGVCFPTEWGVTCDLWSQCGPVWTDQC